MSMQSLPRQTRNVSFDLNPSARGAIDPRWNAEGCH